MTSCMVMLLHIYVPVYASLNFSTGSLGEAVRAWVLPGQCLYSIMQPSLVLTHRASSEIQHTLVSVELSVEWQLWKFYLLVNAM